MQYRTLGTTGLNVSTVALGCWAITGDFTWGDQPESDSIATIHAALDAGVNLFDTAEVYGNGSSEVMLGKALGVRRADVIIASKVHETHLAYDQVVTACEQSLARLGTDWIDLYQVHWPKRDVPWQDTFAALNKLKEQGKIRHIGLSNFGLVDLADLPPEATRLGDITSNQLIYNLLARAIEFEILPACADRDIGVLCYSPLAQGLLTGKFNSADEVPLTRARTRHFSKQRKHTRHGCDGCEAETFEAIDKLRTICDDLGQSMADVALAWVLHQRGITSVLAGGRTPQQVAQNIRAASLSLDQNTLKALSDATDTVKQALGPSPDLWESPENARMK